MDDIEAVQVADCSCDLPEIEGGQILLAVVSVSDLFEEAAMSSEFQQEIYLRLIRKEAVKFENVGVISVKLNFYLLYDLVLHAGFFHISFIDHFNGQYKACSKISGHVDISKATFS